MPPSELDAIDRGILHLLQENARDATIEAMASRVGVSASTVRNRIQKMEDEGVIVGYQPVIDYEAAGFQLHLLFVCNADSAERTRRARDVRSVHGVVSVHELVDGGQNLLVEAIATDTTDMARIHDDLEATGLDLQRTAIYRSQHVQPFDHFTGAASDEGPEEASDVAPEAAADGDI